jgi:hypothetical protein
MVWGVLAELAAAGLVTLADKGYQGSAYAKIPYRGKNKPQSQKEANRAHAQLRAPGERRTRSSRRGGFCVSSAAAPGAPDSSQRPSTLWRFTPHKEGGKGSRRACFGQLSGCRPVIRLKETCRGPRNEECPRSWKAWQPRRGGGGLLPQLNGQVALRMLGVLIDRLLVSPSGGMTGRLAGEGGEPDAGAGT